ncbi:DUF2948 family protein [soil metagenome]
MALLRLTALDPGDLEILSLHFQDAIVRAGDMHYLPRQKRFVMAVNRFSWETAKRPGPYERRRTALHFERVLSVKSQRLRQDDPNAVAEILSLTFETGVEPAGAIVIALSGGGTLRLAVDYVEGRMKDLGPVWRTPHLPRHDHGDGA